MVRDNFGDFFPPVCAFLLWIMVRRNHHFSWRSVVQETKEAFFGGLMELRNQPLGIIIIISYCISIFAVPGRAYNGSCIYRSALDITVSHTVHSVSSKLRQNAKYCSRQLTDRSPTVGQQSADRQPTVGQQFWPKLLAVCWLIVGRLLANS